MSAVSPAIILASASPRRRDILGTLGISFQTQPSLADETSLDVQDDVEFAREAALMKLRSVLATCSQTGAYVLAADTIVCVNGQRLGKPRDRDDAIVMLEELAGRRHVVRTAIALGRVGDDAVDCRVVETIVEFREAARGELERYVASGECDDKAGAYGIQGLASGFVTRIEGSYTNVVGLPAVEVVHLLLEHGALERWP